MGVLLVLVVLVLVVLVTGGKLSLTSTRVELSWS